ncbi:hypothetical protein SERLADRAFT_405941 [Serpula lacrymans var. lacrymans S7.9]|uniref:Uncharacterized protein n=1 Tax=Serpula lacrymans var. lacrymans (strain S7.9) TaxID=578457 RepID=F8NKB1_SERL9|nr:uncharacterized protein SERLADRAFT_405941 [Serpula lacrymans var. lacrymans S7.9]EGO28377.1 hypothetical protein SERLADRAFT_405941 [Serpula lacrymans var. lacrymans S7.9]
MIQLNYKACLNYQKSCPPEFSNGENKAKLLVLAVMEVKQLFKNDLEGLKHFLVVFDVLGDATHAIFWAETAMSQVFSHAAPSAWGVITTGQLIITQPGHGTEKTKPSQSEYTKHYGPELEGHSAQVGNGRKVAQQPTTRPNTSVQS